MHCAQIEEMMAEALQARLSAGEGVLFQEHLASCGVCRAEFESFQAVAGTLEAAFPRQAGGRDRRWREISAAIERKPDAQLAHVLLNPHHSYFPPHTARQHRRRVYCPSP